MAQHLINTGAAANDGSGDPLRLVFIKINNNFAELFAACTDSTPELIATGTSSNDGHGDTLSAAFYKMNLNFGLLYALAPALHPVSFSLTNPFRLTFERVNTSFHDLYGALIPALPPEPPAEPVLMSLFAPLSSTVVLTNEYINIGNLPNDGEGDPLRTAFSKINNNFAELFAAPFNTVSANTSGADPNQVIFTSLANAFTQGKFQINSSNPLTNDSQDITLAVAKNNDSTSVKFTGYGTLFHGSPVTKYDMDVDSGNVRILCSPLTTSDLIHLISYQVTTNI